VQIWPAIDLLGGKCVRLEQGDYARDTVFDENPARIARRWFEEGAEFLHCVDLDGAKSGSIVNETAIRGIIDVAHGHPIQLGGGVRDEATIERLLKLGLSRLVVGTAALRNPEWFATMCQRYRGHMVLGVDARDGMVATQGWLDVSTTPAHELIDRIGQITTDCVAVVYTDIARDGMLEGPNLESFEHVQSNSPFPVIASGGVTTMDDVRALISLNAAGAIIGKALYVSRLQLPRVLEISKESATS
jgi:phosphoribosylformimino-5-aminoimidazole carboxamide ribotide isomerase